MYWYKSGVVTLSILFGGIIVILLLPACKPGSREAGASLKYFDIKGYFEKDSARLTKQNNLVFKTVTHNGVTQRKKVHIANWGTELSLFKQSDINKPAWRNSYEVSNDRGVLSYKARDTDFTMREMLIKMDKQKVKSIIIFNVTKNMLYRTTEKLSYFPDSLYLIEKYQKLRLMGSNKYMIEGQIIR